MSRIRTRTSQLWVEEDLLADDSASFPTFLLSSSYNYSNHSNYDKRSYDHDFKYSHDRYDKRHDHSTFVSGSSIPGCTYLLLTCTFSIAASGSTLILVTEVSLRFFSRFQPWDSSLVEQIITNADGTTQTSTGVTAEQTGDTSNSSSNTGKTWGIVGVRGTLPSLLRDKVLTILHAQGVVGVRSLPPRSVLP